MKALRLLTGIHAGAQVRLTSGSYRIGVAEDADICISDWAVDEIVLVLSEDGVARICSANGEEVLVADFVAVPFGDVVLCLGPNDGAWPRDLDLLACLWKTAEAAEPAPPADLMQRAESDTAVAAAPTLDDTNQATDPVGLRQELSRSSKVHWRTAAVALTCTAAIGTIAVTGMMLAGSEQSEAASVRFAPEMLSKQLEQALHREGLGDLRAIADKHGVAVQGIVSTGNDSVKAQRVMDSLARGKARREYDIAQQDVDNIQQSFAGTGAAVHYAGHGVFTVTGNVQSMASFRVLVAGVRADLDSNVKRLDVDVKEAQPPVPDVDYTAVVATGALRYIETPDGTKHLFPSSNEEATN
jgi:type III secretion protein D